MNSQAVQVGVIGTGFVSRHFVQELGYRKNYDLSRVLTRRNPSDVEFPVAAALTRDLDTLVRHSDIIVECTGDVGFATETIPVCLKAGLPVVTLNPEFHVTVGSAFAGLGYLTEAEGDQPGCEAALAEEAVSMGFKPVMYGNMKGFLNRHPTEKEMAYWGEKQGISIPMVTSFTDGTKLQVEQALVANGLGGTIAQQELIGLAKDDLSECAGIFGATAERLRQPIADYVLSSKLPHGVFVVATHQDEQVAALRYLKLGEGPFYVLQKNNIFVHLELFKTLDRVVAGKPPLLTNSASPQISVASIAKQALKPGDHIERGCGSFKMRGVCVRMNEVPDHLPIGLADNLRIARKIEPGQLITMNDVELPRTAALDAWEMIVGKTQQGAVAAE